MMLETAQIRGFIDALQDSDPTCRSKALHFIKILGPKAKPALATVIEATRDPDRNLRAQAAYALGDIGPAAAEAIPVLIEALKARDAALRWSARRALRLIQTDQRSK
jgi:HEAT repeat protein